MLDDTIFDDAYAGKKSTKSESAESELKKFLKEPVKDEEIKTYGSSKPKRVLIKGKISDR